MPTAKARPQPTKVNWSGIGLILVVLVILGGWSAYWVYVRDQASAILAEQADDLRAQGYTVSWADTRQDGFPTVVRNTFDAPAIASNTAGGDSWSWSGQGFRVDVRPYDLTLLSFEPLGEQLIQSADLGMVRATFDALRASVRSDGSGLKQLTVEADTLEARSETAPAATRIGALDLVLDRDAADAGRYVVTGSGEALSWPTPRGQGGADRLTLAGEAIRLDVLTASGALDEAALSAWAAAGGGVKVDDLSLAWDETSLGGAADLKLDVEGYWNGVIRINARNPADALRRLADMGLIDAPTAARLSAVLGMATKADGSASFAFDVRRGEIRVLGQTIGRLPRAF